MQRTATRRSISLGVVLAATLLSVVVVPAARAAGVGAQTIASGLNYPAGFTFAPDGRIFYGERFTGEIHVLSSDGSTDTLFATIPNVVSNGEQGLLGIALDPAFGPSGGTVFAYATRDDGGTLHND